MAEQLRVSKAGAYVEELGAGASGGSLLVSKVGAYVEIDTGALRISKVGAYVEIGQTGVYVSKVGIYVEVGIPDTPVKLKDGLDIIYANNSLRDYISTFDIGVVVKVNSADNFAVQALQAAGLASWECNLSGVWAKALDDIFGEEVVDRGNSDLLADCKIVLGRWGNQVGYFWLVAAGDGAFVKMYRTKMSIDNVMLFDATLALSGAPERGTS